MKATQPIAPLPGAPLTIQDILMERIQFEDRLMHRDFVVRVDPPEVMAKELPTQRWNSAAKYAFNSQIMRFIVSLKNV
jgi:hypothetical protein